MHMQLTLFSWSVQWDNFVDAKLGVNKFVGRPRDCQGDEGAGRKGGGGR